jgi:hypothetical protein
MLCEKYKPALIEAAITGVEPTSAIREHVESCATCAAELTQQRRLIASIDANLHRQMNVPVPASILHRLEAHVAQQPQSLPSRSLKLAWLYTAAALAAAAALILFTMPRLRTHKPNTQAIAHSQPAPFQAARPSTNERPEMIPLPLKPAPQLETRSVKRHSQAVAASQPEVLVPPDEQIALNKFVAHWSVRREFVVAFATPVDHGFEPPFKGLEIPDINTAEIVIEPISTEARK